MPETDWAEAILCFVITDRWADGDLLVFLKRDAVSGDAVVVAINRGDSPTVARFAAPSDWGAGPAWDAWNGADVPLTGGMADATLDGKCAAIAVRERRH